MTYMLNQRMFRRALVVIAVAGAISTRESAIPSMSTTRKSIS